MSTQDERFEQLVSDVSYMINSALVEDLATEWVYYLKLFINKYQIDSNLPFPELDDSELKEVRSYGSILRSINGMMAYSRYSMYPERIEYFLKHFNLAYERVKRAQSL